MEAKDTVIDTNITCNAIGHCHRCQLRLAQAQAEISFKAGIREVVEWLERCKKIKVPKYQLKEWGL